MYIEIRMKKVPTVFMTFFEFKLAKYDNNRILILI
jgi:hypothetical protein